MDTAEQVWLTTSNSRTVHLFRDDSPRPICGAISKLHGQVIEADDRPKCPRCLERQAAPVVDEMCAVTGATYRQIDYWVRQGLLIPGNPAPGTGGYRIWPPGEIAVGRQMVQLMAAGLSLRAAHHAARNGGLLPGGRYRITSDANAVAA